MDLSLELARLPLVPVSSGHLDAVVWSEAENALLVRFQNGAVYAYIGTLPSHVDRVSTGGGVAFVSEVRSRYPSRRLL